MKSLKPLLTIAFAAGSLFAVSVPASAQTATSGAETPGTTAAPATGQMNPTDQDKAGSGNMAHNGSTSMKHKKHSHMSHSKSMSHGNTSMEEGNTGTPTRPGTPSSHTGSGDGPQGMSNDNGAGR